MSAHGEHHVMPMKTYYTVYGTLLVCTALTYAVSELGPSMGVAAGSALSITIAMAVAFTKAFLVAAWFMHLKYDTRFNVFTFISALWFMGVFFVFTMFDIGSRDAINEVSGNFVLRTEVEAAEQAEVAP
jgi:cytochrome c oxidase subunit 4